MVGAKPVFVDIDETFTLDPQKIEAKITPATRAIIPVHLYGQTANMDEIMKIAKKHGLLVLEDCAQAHGSAYNGKKAGTLGDAASFSFYPGKNLGAYGDAGCMVTSEAKIEEKARMLANHGQKEKHHHLIEGKNSRMDGIQAAILSIKLKYLDEWNRKRKQHAKLYSQLIKNKNIILPEIATNRDHVFHLYVIRTPQRERLIQLLDEKGISWGIHYPFPLPLLKAYEKMGHKEADFPVAAQVCNEILSIPMYPELSDKQIEFIADTINSFKIG
jgi:dTDP-4-amino-4,6-dideoxygalactose transaminase